MNRGLPLLLASALLVPLLSATAPRAAALPKEGDPLLVEVTSYAPLNPTPDGAITVQGQVTNASQSDVNDLKALLRVSSEPLSSRSDVVAVTDLTTSRRGVAMESTVTDVAPALAPGAAAQVSVTAPMADLPVGRNGVYAFFLEVRSSEGTFNTSFPVTWFPAAQTLNPSRIVALNPIRSGVDVTGNKTLLSDQLLQRIETGGSLDDLASGGAKASTAAVPLTWLIDPAVTAAAAALASGQGSFPPSVADPEAAKATMAMWLRTVAAGSSAASSLTYVTPYAEVDAQAAIEAGIPDLVQQSISASQGAAAASIPVRNGLIAAPPQGNADGGTIGAYKSADVETVILSDTVLPPVQRLPYTPSGVSTLELPGDVGISAVIPDSGLADALLRPSGTAAEQFRLQADVLAQAAMITLEQPLSSRTVVLLPSAETAVPADIYAGLLTSLSQAPYIRMVGLPALFEPDVPRVTRDLKSVPAQPPLLSSEYLAPIPPLAQRLTNFAAVTVDPPLFEQDFRTAILRSASANWRPDPKPGSALLAATSAELAAQEQKVTTVSTGTVTFTGSSGTLPLTISNDLSQAVDVGVLLQAEPSVRLSFTSPGLVRVEAGRRVSIEIPVEVFGTGPLPVSVVLTDRDGRPFVTTGDLVIRATGARVAAALVAILGAIALAILVFWRFRRRGADPA